jgi:hypothetical protein
MKLRPHHLLCTQGYSGKGYNDDFVLNMTAITKRLKNDENVVVEIVFSTDDICDKCPKMLDVDLCQDNDKAKCFDKKTIDYFGLEEKSYIYKNIIREINAKMTQAMLDDICHDCSWYPVSACKKNILGCAGTT